MRIGSAYRGADRERRGQGEGDLAHGVSPATLKEDHDVQLDAALAAQPMPLSVQAAVNLGKGAAELDHLLLGVGTDELDLERNGRGQGIRQTRYFMPSS